MRIINFLTIILHDGSFKDVDDLNKVVDRLMTEKLFRIVSLCYVKPEAVGFNISDKVVLENLPGEVLETQFSYFAFITENLFLRPSNFSLTLKFKILFFFLF